MTTPVSDALAELMSLGVTGDALVAAIRRLEIAAYEERIKSLQEAVATASAREDAALAMRQARLARDAERKRRARPAQEQTVSAEFHGRPRTSTDVHGPPEQKVSPTPPSKTQTPVPPSPPKGGSSPKVSGFDRFWEAYDRKVGKGAARRAYDRAEAKLRAEGRDPLPTILAALDRVRPTWDDPEFIPHPSTWLNGERWDDEPELPPPKAADQASDYAARHMPARLDVSLDDLKAQLDAELGDAA